MDDCADLRRAGGCPDLTRAGNCAGLRRIENGAGPTCAADNAEPSRRDDEGYADPIHAGDTTTLGCGESRADPRRTAGHAELGRVEGGADPTPEDSVLDRLARAAQAGDPVARNALYAHLAERIAALARICRRAAPDLDADELVSEGYLALADLVTSWDGHDFEDVFRRTFPSRLRRALLYASDRRLRWSDRTLPDVPDVPAALAPRLAELIADLTPGDQWLLREHGLAGHALVTLACAYGASQRTLYRRWRSITATLRAGLIEPAARPGLGERRPARRPPERT